MRKIVALAALVAAVCVGGPAFACKGKTVLFEDNFTDDSNFGDVSQYGGIADGVFKVIAQKGYNYHFFYQGDSYDKADICIDVAQLTSGDAGGGLLFAAQGGDSYYYFWVNPAGVAGISHLANHKWLNPVPARKLSNLDPKKITLRLTLNGAKATAYVNGQKIADFKVAPVEGGGFVGVGADGGPEGITWGFSNLKVTDLP
jgi:hypothetical protein